MQRSEIKPRLFYATVEADLVRPVSDADSLGEVHLIEETTQRLEDEKLVTETREFIHRGSTKSLNLTDTWRTDTGGSQVRTRVLTRSGVEVELWKSDADGRPIEPERYELRRTVLPATQFLMLWSDFVLEHPERIRSKITALEAADAAAMATEWLRTVLEDYARIPFPVQSELDLADPNAGAVVASAEAQLWTLRGHPAGHDDLAGGYTVQPSITFHGTEAVSWLWNRLRQGDFVPLGPQGTDPDTRAVEIAERDTWRVGEASDFTAARRLRLKADVSGLEPPKARMEPVGISLRVAQFHARHHPLDFLQGVDKEVVKTWCRENDVYLYGYGGISKAAAVAYYNAHRGRKLSFLPDDPDL